MSDPTQPIVKGQPLKPEEVAKGMTITVEHIYGPEQSIAYTGVVTHVNSYDSGGVEVPTDWEVSLDMGTTHGHAMALISRPYFDVEVTAGTLEDKYRYKVEQAIRQANMAQFERETTDAMRIKFAPEEGN